jgi:uncharacterized membrane protein YgdD (TMEM256/DUF423 family)
MPRFWILAAGIAGFVGVALGAMGAHGPGGSGPDPRLLEIASRYAMYHALALLAVAVLSGGRPVGRGKGWLDAAGACFAVGVLLFCGSIVLLAVTQVPQFGYVTPIGGVAFLIGWAALAVSALLRRPAAS